MVLTATGQFRFSFLENIWEVGDPSWWQEPPWWIPDFPDVLQERKSKLACGRQYHPLRFWWMKCVVMRLVANLLWFWTDRLCNALVVRIQSSMSPSRAVLYGDPPMCARRFWERRFLFSFKSSTCATIAGVCVFSDYVVICSPKTVATPYITIY